MTKMKVPSPNILETLSTFVFLNVRRSIKTETASKVMWLEKGL